MIIFLYGEDTFRSRQKLKEIKEKFLREVDPSGNSIVCLEGANLDMAKLNETAGASSLFSRRRMVIIEKLFMSKSQVLLDETARYLKNNSGKRHPELSSNHHSGTSGEKTGVSDENIIIFWDEAIDEKASKTELFDFLSHQKFAYIFKPLSATDTIAWIRKESEKRGAKITHSAAAMLAGLLANNLWQLDNELNKLISFKAVGQYRVESGVEIAINEADIADLTRGNYNESIFALTDAIGSRNKSLAAGLFEKELEAGVEEIGLLAMIIRQFRIMMLVRQCLDKSYTSRKIASALRLPPFVVQKNLNQVRNFPLAGLKRILNHLVEMDKDVKTGQAEAKSALSVLLAKI